MTERVADEPKSSSHLECFFDADDGREDASERSASKFGGSDGSVSEAATDFEDDKPVIVGYIRGDRSVVAAELIEELIRDDGVSELRLRLLETGERKRVFEERVDRLWQL